jgi:hypothetical protein
MSTILAIFEFIAPKVGIYQFEIDSLNLLSQLLLGMFANCCFAAFYVRAG